MEIRDMFAAAALQGILSGKWAAMPQSKPERAFARMAWIMADEMMSQRHEEYKRSGSEREPSFAK